MYPNISFLCIPSKTPPESPRTPRSNVSSESSTRARLATVYINNRAIYVPEGLKDDVCHAVDRIRSDCFNALTCKREVLLEPDVLIALLNHAKLYWHAWLDKQPEETSASDRIENAFINNKNLSQEESEWVSQIISDYKNTVELTVYQNTPRPIAPPPSITSVALEAKCSCNLL